MIVEIRNNGLIIDYVVMPNFREAVMFTQRFNRVSTNKGFTQRAVIA
jgi:hypothetical protein